MRTVQVVQVGDRVSGIYDGAFALRDRWDTVDEMLAELNEWTAFAGERVIVNPEGPWG